MPKPRELRRRIKSVQSTRKITKTMELVATSKLKRAQDRVVAARPYAASLAEVMADLYSPDLAERFPLLRQPVAGMAGGRGRVRALPAHHAPGGGGCALQTPAARDRPANLQAHAA